MRDLYHIIFDLGGGLYDLVQHILPEVTHCSASLRWGSCDTIDLRFSPLSIPRRSVHSFCSSVTAPTVVITSASKLINNFVVGDGTVAIFLEPLFHVIQAAPINLRRVGLDRPIRQKLRQFIEERGR